MNRDLDLYEEFGIVFLSRRNIKFYFTINHNAVVEKYLDLVIRTLCFYTLGLFETSSGPDGFLTYRNGDKILTKSIEEACRDYIRDMESLYDEDGDFVYPKYVQNVDPIRSYIRKKQEYTGIGYCIGVPGDKVILDTTMLNNPNFDANIEAEIDSLMDPPEIMHVLDLLNPPLIESMPIGSMTLEKHRYPVDNFTIYEIEPDYYECTFLPREGYHHASCYTAAKCTVKWTNCRVDDISTIYLWFRNRDQSNDDTMKVKVIYYGIDCL